MDRPRRIHPQAGQAERQAIAPQASQATERAKQARETKSKENISKFIVRLIR